MTSERPTQERRAADARLVLLERDMQELLVTVKAIDLALRFPEQSPLGRQLLDRAERNSKSIDRLSDTADKHGDRIDDLESRVDELNGVAKAMRVVSVLVGIAVGLLTLFALAGGR